MGVTSMRDPGNDDARTIDRRTRAAAGELLFAARLPVVADRRQGPVHRAGGQRRDQRGGSDRARRQGQGERLHRREVLRHLQPGVAAGEHSPRRTSSGCTCTATFRPACGRSTPSTPATTRSRTSTGSMMQAMPDSVIRGIQRHHAFRRPGTLREGRRPRRPAIEDDHRDDGERSTSTAIRRWWRSRACTCRRTAICRRPTRRSSARCRRPPSAASAPAASRCRRI